MSDFTKSVLKSSGDEPLERRGGYVDEGKISLNIKFDFQILFSKDWVDQLNWSSFQIFLSRGRFLCSFTSFSLARAPRKRSRVALSPVQSQGLDLTATHVPWNHPQTYPWEWCFVDIQIHRELKHGSSGRGPETERPLSAICSLKISAMCINNQNLTECQGGGFIGLECLSYFPKISNEPWT